MSTACIFFFLTLCVQDFIACFILMSCAERAERDAIACPSLHPWEENEIWWWTQETTLVSLFCVCWLSTILKSLQGKCCWCVWGSSLVLPSHCFYFTCDFRNGYQKFSQEMLSNGELNHLPMKERMGEIGGRWQRLPQKEKDRYKRLAEEKQRQYKVLFEQWLAVHIFTVI